MGGTPTLLGFSGGPTGKRMEDIIEREGIPASWIQTETETRVCQTLLDEKRGRIRELVEDAAPINGKEWASFFRTTEEQLDTRGFLCLCGSLPRNSPPDIQSRLVGLAHAQRTRVILDATGPALNATLPLQPWLIKINRQELQQTTECQDVATGIAVLLDRGAQQVLITDGPDTCHYGGSEGRSTFSLPAIQAVNPIGSGDTVTGVLAWTQATGGIGSMNEAIALALGAGLAQAETERPAEFDPERAQVLSKEIRIA